MSINKDVSSKVNYSNGITQTFWDQLATYISIVFSPPLVVIYGVIIATPFLNVSSPWLWSMLFITLPVIPPTFFVYNLLRKGLIEDFHMNVRKERLKPLFVILFNTLLGISVFYLLSGPKFLIILSICCLLSVVMMFFVTLFWKISGHSVAAGGLCVIMLSLLSESAIPFTILIPIIAWSRFKLSRHSVSQTIAGVILGILSFGIPLYFTGLI
ncbi:MAG: phosphatase PAP2 family protein [Thermodesulfobacteriota bacterium]